MRLPRRRSRFHQCIGGPDQDVENHYSRDGPCGNRSIFPVDPGDADQAGREVLRDRNAPVTSRRKDSGSEARQVVKARRNVASQVIYFSHSLAKVTMELRAVSVTPARALDHCRNRKARPASVPKLGHRSSLVRRRTPAGTARPVRCTIKCTSA